MLNWIVWIFALNLHIGAPRILFLMCTLSISGAKVMLGNSCCFWRDKDVGVHQFTHKDLFHPQSKPLLPWMVQHLFSGKTLPWHFKPYMCVYICVYIYSHAYWLNWPIKTIKFSSACMPNMFASVNLIFNQKQESFNHSCISFHSGTTSTFTEYNVGLVFVWRVQSLLSYL